MKLAKSLETIRRAWLERVSSHVAASQEFGAAALSGAAPDAQPFLVTLFDQLAHAAETGTPDPFIAVLDEWTILHLRASEGKQPSGLSNFLGQIHLLTLEVARQELREADALETIAAVTPIFVQAEEHILCQEVMSRVEVVTSELEQANTALQRMDQSKSDFLSIAAHELKTPLTLIEGYTDMLRDLLPKGDGFLQARILLKGVDNGTIRLREIIDDMIDASLIDNQMLSLHFQPVWVNRILLILKKEFTRAVIERRQTLELPSFAGGEEMTFGDEERLFQAFRNIISNAIKFTPDGGKITIQNRTLPGFIEVSVSDTGIGIDPADHARIFKKFGRLGNVSLHSSGKTKFKGGGPGLGLPIAKGIVEAHGGTIWVDSVGYDEKKCPGATFHILLPVRKMPPDDRSAKLFAPVVGIDEAIIS